MTRSSSIIPTLTRSPSRDSQAVRTITLLVDTATLDIMAGGTLTVGTGTGTVIDNAGLLELTGGGVLDVKGNQINNTGAGPHQYILANSQSTFYVDTWVGHAQPHRRAG